MAYTTLDVKDDGGICFLRFNRPEANNTINSRLIQEFREALARCRGTSNVVVLEGSATVFCMGADFSDTATDTGRNDSSGAAALYDVWQELASGPFVTVAHVRGKVNAGGIGFVAASDLVIADASATFGLSELLFGLMPACVLPFLIRRVGVQRAHYMTLLTRPFSVEEVSAWGLVDAHEVQSGPLLRKHLARLRHLTPVAVQRYKRYLNELVPGLSEFRERAVAVNREVFSDPANLKKISSYVTSGRMPWEE